MFISIENLGGSHRMNEDERDEVKERKLGLTPTTGDSYCIFRDRTSQTNYAYRAQSGEEVMLIHLRCKVRYFMRTLKIFPLK